MRRVKIGLCGFTIAMGSYPRTFPIVEVQQTFYQPPADAILRRWRSTMPEAFEFTIKAWQLITHPSKSPTYRRLRRPLTEAERLEVGNFRETGIVEEGWRVTLHCARLLGATAILFECPASFRPTGENVANLRRFFKKIDHPPGVRLLWEPRGEWPEALLTKLCGELDLVHVVDPFLIRSVTSGFNYYRLHGITGARHVYSDDELARLRATIPDRGETCVMFNNIPRAVDAVRFGRMIGEGLAPEAL